MTQGKLFHTSAYVHMCLNEDCFYCETILDFPDVVLKHVWDSNLEDLTLIPHCPSCDEVLWREVNDAYETQ